MPTTSELYCVIETRQSRMLDEPDAEPRMCPNHIRRGHFPQTRSTRGRPLAAVVCVSESGASVGEVAVRPLALLRTHGRGEEDEIVVCAAIDAPGPPRQLERIADMPRRLRRQIEHAVAGASDDWEDAVTAAWCSREDALTAIDDAAARWAQVVDGRG